jgi:hypothetical protein
MPATTTLRTGKLPVRKVSAVRRRAQALGLTPEEYLRQLIENDLAVSAKARTTSLDELAAPFREALGGLSGQELDRRVKAARSARARNGSSHPRR